MVALCSPRSVESQYCTQEIQHFKQTGRSDRLIAAILAGEPGKEGAECFCPPLRHPVREDGTLNTSIVEEPIAADFRVKDQSGVREGFTSAEAYRFQLSQRGDLDKKHIKKRAEVYESQLQLMKLKIIAGILGVPLEQLRNRDKAYQLELAKKRTRVLRNWLGTVLTLLIVALALSVFAYLKEKEANAQRDSALTNEGRFYLEVARDNDNHPGRSLWAAQAISFEEFGRSSEVDHLQLRDAQFWQNSPPRITNGRSPAEFDEASKLINQSLPPHRPILVGTSSGSEGFSAIDWNPDGKRIASASRDGTVCIWDLSTSQAFAPLGNKPHARGCISWDPSGERLATASGDGSGKINIWDSDSGSLLQGPLSRTLDLEYFSELAWHPEGTILASSSETHGDVVLWDVVSGQQIGEPLESTDGDAFCVSWSPNGTKLAVGHEFGAITVWDVSKKVVFERQFRGHTERVTSLVWSPDSAKLASASTDSSIQVWDTVAGRALHSPLEGHEDSVLDISWNPNGDLIASGSSDGSIILWDAFRGAQVGDPLSGHSNSVMRACWSPDGRETRKLFS